MAVLGYSTRGSVAYVAAWRTLKAPGIASFVRNGRKAGLTHKTLVRPPRSADTFPLNSAEMEGHASIKAMF